MEFNFTDYDLVDNPKYNGPVSVLCAIGIVASVFVILASLFSSGSFAWYMLVLIVLFLTGWTRTHKRKVPAEIAGHACDRGDFLEITLSDVKWSHRMYLSQCTRIDKKKPCLFRYREDQNRLMLLAGGSVCYVTPDGEELPGPSFDRQVIYFCVSGEDCRKFEKILETFGKKHEGPVDDSGMPGAE